MGRLVCGAVLLGLFAAILPGVRAQDDAKPESSEPGERWAVILVGIPGDAEHETLFEQVARSWERWLITDLQFAEQHVVRLPSPDSGRKARLTAEAIRTTLSELSDKLREQDSLWVFTLGHGNCDGKQAWFHVSGRDPSSSDFGRWLSEVRCRQQVLWLTQANSGWFVKPLSRPGRIVIAATAADDESNETEFPEALVTIAGREPAALDTDDDGQVSIAELFTAVTTEVLHRFTSDKQLPTEHAQLDDNGDGRGTEEIAVRKPAAPEEPADPGTTAPRPPAPAAKVDGDLARTTFAPYRPFVKPEPENQPEPAPEQPVGTPPGTPKSAP